MNTVKVSFKGVEYDVRHGGPFDRGSADSYYHRAREPHYYQAGTGDSHMFEQYSKTSVEIAEYDAGYDHNQQFGSKKDYSD